MKSLSKEGENKKQQNRREQYKNLSKDEKKMFVEYKKNIKCRKIKMLLK